MLIKLIAAFAGAFLLTGAAGKVLVPALKKMKAGQMIRSDGPKWHISKQGTPTMGGIMFIFGVTVLCLAAGFESMMAGDFTHIFILAFSLIYAAIGFLDDYEKLKKKRNMGLTASQKFMLQLIVAVVLVLLLRYTGMLSPNFYIPFIYKTVPLHELIYVVLSAFIIVACVNAVNITDGADGLAAGVSIPVALCYTALAFTWGYLAIGIFGAALAGGLCAFLIFNFYPAKVFMGDTGSLFLGAAVCATAFALDIPLILVTLGIVYVIETLSDIIQIFYFKITHGKRVFKMAPLHHHFEMCGWSEIKLFIVFTAVSAVFAVISYLAVYERFSIGIL